MIFMTILRVILVVLLCVPIGYLLLSYVDRLIVALNKEQKEIQKRKNDEKRVVYNDRRSRWGR